MQMQRCGDGGGVNAHSTSKLVELLALTTHLEQGVRVLQEPPRNRVARLVERHRALLLLRHQAVAPLQAANHPVDGRLKVLEVNLQKAGSERDRTRWW